MLTFEFLNKKVLLYYIERYVIYLLKNETYIDVAYLESVVAEVNIVGFVLYVYLFLGGGGGSRV